VQLQSFIATGGLLFALPLGYLSDRVRRVRLLQFNAIASTVGNIAMAFAGSPGVYVGTSLFGSITGDLSDPAVQPLLADWYPSNARARIFSFWSLTGSIGALLSTVVAGYMITRLGWRETLLIMSVISLAVIPLYLLLREPVRGGIDRLEAGATAERAAIPPPVPSFSEAVRGAFAVRTVWILAIATMVLTIASTPADSISQIILAQRFLLSPVQRGFLMDAQHLILIPCTLLGAVLADRYLTKRPRIVISGVAILYMTLAGAYVVEAVAPSALLFTIPSVFVGIVAAAFVPAQFALLSLVIPARYRATGMQVSVVFMFFGSLIAAVMSNSLVSNGSSSQSSFFIFAIFAAVAAVIALFATGSVDRDMRAARAAARADEEVEQARREQADKILVVRDLDAGYDGVQVLFNVDLDVREGEILALVGTNGAGKSTLLRAICGLQQADNGAVFYDGVNITFAPANENATRGLVYMPGGRGVFPGLTVRENLASALLAQTTAGGDNEIERALELFPVLRERIDTAASLLSGGEQQMLAMAQALVMRPRLLMIDELSLGLAPAVVEKLLSVVRILQASGVTIILVEQSLNVALTVAQRAVFMDRGAVQFDGPTEDLLGRPDLVRSIFMGGVPATTLRRPLADLNDSTKELRASNLTVEFGNRRALDSVSLSLSTGQVVGIIGPNGAGKTTLFDVLSGYTKAAEGAVFLDELDITSLRPDARARLGVGRAFQSARLFPPLTVRENISVALERRANKSALTAALWLPAARKNERRLRERVDGFIELLGLGDHADKLVRELSTGTRRAVEIACQMAAEPLFLLLDEPSSGLAQAESEVLGPTLMRIVRDTGCGLLVIEHDLNLITQLSERLIAMDLGRIIASGAPAEVIEDAEVMSSYLAASNDVIERSGSRVGSVLATMDNRKEKEQS